MPWNGLRLGRVLLFVRPLQSTRIAKARAPHSLGFARRFCGRLHENGAGHLAREGQICRSMAKIGDVDFVTRCRDVSGWVVFSDLHVSKRTLPACIETLRAVRREAEARGAGVLMLGDFWQHKGSLPVEPLNAVISEMRPWGFPTLMLTGNHDQVDLKGYLHALVPLAAGCPNVHVFDEPTLFLDAVFISYHTDPKLLDATLKKLVDPRTKAVFVHADVIGAIMNDSFRAKEGLHPDSFPPRLLVFSGHYHKPHIVEGTTIEYVGSPYQVSQAEAGQTKHLLVLDTNWNVVDRKPLDVGPRHFTLKGIDAVIPDGLRKGDRLRWYIDANQDEDIKDAETLLRTKGVTVDVIIHPSSSVPRIEQAETLVPSQLFQKYADSIEMTSGAVDKGQEVLKGVVNQVVDYGNNSLQRTATTVHLESVEMEGFGPFLRKVTYPLDEGGVRVVCGRNEDDSTSQSNGAGKSMLVSAPLWALTGRIDVRGEMSGRPTNADIVHDEATSARVKVTGTVNGDPFVVERVVKRRGKGSLTFLVGDKDLTKSEAKLTQAEIEEIIHAEMLASLAFYGHGNVTALLDANDTAFKAELGKIVDLDIWQRAREVTWAELKSKQAELEKECYGLELLRTTLADLEAELAAAKTESLNWQSEREERLRALQANCDRNARVLADLLIHGLEVARLIESWLKWAKGYNPTSSIGAPGDEGGFGIPRGGFPPWEGEDSRKGVFSFSASEPEAAPWDADYKPEQHEEGVPSKTAPWDDDFMPEQMRAAAAPWDKSFEAEGNEEAEKGKRIRELKAMQMEVVEEDTMDVVFAPGSVGIVDVEPDDVVALRQHLDDLKEQHVEQEKDAAMKKGLFEANKKAYVSYLELSEGHSKGGMLTCNTCLQEIDLALFKKTCEKLKVSMDGAEEEYRYSWGAACNLLKKVQSEAKQLSKRVKLWQDEVVYAQNARKLEEQKDEAKRLQHQKVLEDRRAAEMQAIREFEEKIAFAKGSITQLHQMQQRLLPRLTSFRQEKTRVSKVQKMGLEIEDSEKIAWRGISDIELTLEHIPELIADAENADYSLALGLEKRGAVQNEQDPHTAEVKRFTGLAHQQNSKIEKSELQTDRLAKEKGVVSELYDAFRPGGVSSFVLEGIVSDLQHRSTKFIDHLSPGTSLALKCTKANKSNSSSLERITKEFAIRTAGGEVRQRTLQQFSSGEVRRLALALSLGFSTLISERGRLRCNMIVFDEALGQLDREGCERVVQLMGNLPQSSTLLVGQDGSFVMQSFDVVDWVVKRNGASTVEVHGHGTQASQNEI